MNAMLKSGLVLLAAGTIQTQTWAEDADPPIATVMSVEDGTCDECPYQQFDKSMRLKVNAQLRASDEVRCSKGAYAIAAYENAFFFLEGTRWNPVGLPGEAPKAGDSHTPLKGSIAYNDIMDADKAARAQIAEDNREYRFAMAKIMFDRNLSFNVKQALVASDIDTSGIKIHTRDGAVSLKGSVPAAAQALKAKDVAESVPGVKDVKNKLAVYESLQK